MPLIDDPTIQIADNGQLKKDLYAESAAPQADAMPFIPRRYEVLDELGRGGMGIVYRVRDIDTLEIVALKILKPEIAGDPAMRESLRNEVCLARKVTHKNVCRIHEFSRFESTACISMEFVDGESLLSKLQNRGSLSCAEAVSIARQICAGLNEAHAQGIVHRDLKPANIVVSENQVVKIMDFGIARQAKETGYTTVALAGTPAYMAPEQVEAKPVSARTDIYALGLLLYEMVTGQQAFSGDNTVAVALQQIRQAPPRPTSLVAGIPSRLEGVILKCLEKNPAHRFASVELLSEALEDSLLPSGQKLSETVLEPAKLAVVNGARAAAFGLDRLADQLHRAAVKAQSSLPPHISAWLNAKVAIARQHALVARLSKPIRTAQLAMVFGATLLSTSVVFALLTHSQTQASAASARAKGQLSATVPVAPVPAAYSPVSLFNDKNVNFAVLDTTDAAMTIASRGDATSLPKSADASRNLAQPRAAAKRKSEAQPAVALQQQTYKASALGPSDPAAALVDALRSSPLPVDGGNDAPATLAALEPAPAPAADGDGISTAQMANTYLEVGSFNDAKWADDAVNKLAALGFHAINVHKSRLWGQSYHVEVGPFNRLADLEETSQQLFDKGFKPRTVK